MKLAIFAALAALVAVAAQTPAPACQATPWSVGGSDVDTGAARMRIQAGTSCATSASAQGVTFRPEPNPQKDAIALDGDHGAYTSNPGFSDRDRFSVTWWWPWASEREANASINPAIFPAFRSIWARCLREEWPHETVRCQTALELDRQCRDCSAQEVWCGLYRAGFDLPSFYRPGFHRQWPGC